LRQSRTFHTLANGPKSGVQLSHVYQRAEGGATLCPLDDKARIVIKSTPRFAKMVAYKFAHNAAPQVLEDLEQSHGRPCLKATLQDLAAYVGTIVQAK
jgi:hypothetical protein